MSLSLDALCGWFEAMTPQTLMQIGDYYTEGASFKDPFNEVVGIKQVYRVYAHMFETLEAPRFKILERMRDGSQGYLVWEFYFSNGGRAMTIRGSSHLRFDASGRIDIHRDYWDAAEELYEKIPVLHLLMRFLRRRIAVKM